MKSDILGKQATSGVWQRKSTQEAILVFLSDIINLMRASITG